MSKKLDTKISDEDRKWVGYVRVSTEIQAKEGVSLEAQKSIIEKYAAEKKFNLVGIHSEQVSGSVNCADRLEFKKIMQKMDTGEINGVIIHKLDRISRNIADQSNVLEKYFGSKINRLIIVEMDRIDLSNPSDKMLLNMLGTLSQYEREIIISRTNTALQYKKQNNEKLGGFLPYGKVLDDNGITMSDNKEELALWNEMKALKEEKKWTYKQICDELVRREIKNRKGIVKWSTSGVLRIMYPDKCPRKAYKRKQKEQ